jgi:hypothetical protein
VRRTLVTIGCGASIAFVLAICALWIRSYTVGDEVSWGSTGRAEEVTLWSRSGSIAVRRLIVELAGRQYSSEALGTSHGWTHQTHPGTFAAPDMDHAVLGFAVERRHTPVVAAPFNGAGWEDSFAFAFPHWSLAVMGAVVGLFLWARVARSRRRFAREEVDAGDPGTLA